MRISALVIVGLVIAPLCAPACAPLTLEQANLLDRQLHTHQRLAQAGVRFGADLPPDFIICVQQPIDELREQPDACMTLGELRYQHFGRARLAQHVAEGPSEESLAPSRAIPPN